MITQESIVNVIDASVVEEVIGDYVNLKRRGVNLLGNCPFHEEKTPSFTVSPAKGIYKCFGCGKAGNSVSFLMEHEQMTFVDAIKHLGNKFNIEVVETKNTSEEKQAVDHRESLQVVLDYAANYYHYNLLESEKGKEIGLSYFIERGISKESIAKWKLGYSFDVWNELVDDADKSGYNLNYLEEVGLIKKNDQDKWYDIFRDRVIFPIQNAQGKIVAFAGRVLQTNVKAAKYLNSPETELYKKSFVLYGLNFAKKAMRQANKCYLTEGYLDVISLSQNGIENVVAASGTAFTEGQAKLIKRFTENVTMLFDGDAAGIKAAFRSIDLLLSFGFNVRVVPMPEGEDPDSLCQKLGKHKFVDFLNDNEQDFIIYKGNLLMDNAKDDPIKKSEFVQEVIQSVALIPDAVKRAFYIQECATLMNINEETLFLELKKRIAQKENRPISSVNEDKKVGKQQTAVIELDENEGIIAQEMALLRLILLYGDKLISDSLTVRDFIIGELEKDETIFIHEMARQILETVKNAEKDIDFNAVTKTANVEQASFLAQGTVSVVLM